MGEPMGGPSLRVTNDRLTDLANDLDDMQDYLNKQVKRMDEIVDVIESGWRGPAAKAYRALHRGAAEDAVRIREVMKVLEQAVRLSRDGFTEQELDIMERFRRIQSSVDVAAEANALSTPNPDAAVPAPPKPQSRISDL
ncbi:WXG100 family type VII secretion target [Streptomyces sp. NPDC005407]|uniref:WXG100 family type VII secretion target n=1 Tax=Streptomyces sp. NPDC005407 TaxID=3155340 RepID=UPI0033A687AA